MTEQYGRSRFEARFPGMPKSLMDGQDGVVESWSIKSDFLTATDEWSLTFYDIADEPDWYEQQPVELYVDGRLQLIGRCDKSRRGGENSSVTLTGRDYIADLIECSLDPTFIVKSGADLESSLLLAMAPCGITSIVTPERRNEVRTGGQFAKKKYNKMFLREHHADEGISMYGWGSRQAARNGFTIQPGNSRSEICLQRPSYDDPTIGKIIAKRGKTRSPGNNVIGGSGVAERNHSTIATYLLAAAQQGETGEQKQAARHKWDLNAVVELFPNTELRQIFQLSLPGRRLPKDTKGLSISSGGLYRLRYFRDKDSRSQEQISAAASRMIAQMLKETLKYTVKLKGTTDPFTGKTWGIDCMVDVDDDLARVHEPLWIPNRTFQGERHGVTTTLEMWRPRTFQIDPGNPISG